MKSHSTILGVMLLTLGLLAIGCTSSDEPLKADSSTLKRTVVTSHMEEKITPGKNLIYCSTFQIAWNELKDNIIKEDIRLTDEPPIVKSLNKSLSTKADISEDCYVAMVGFGKDGVLEKINKALKEKFKTMAPNMEETLAPNDIMAYAYLYKNLEFKVAFESLKDPVGFTSSGGKTTQVKAFGIKKYYDSERNFALAKQVEILDYEGDSDFILGLKSTSLNDEIVLAKVKPERTLLETIEAVLKRTQWEEELKSVDHEKLEEAIVAYRELAKQGKKDLLSKEYKKVISDYQSLMKKVRAQSLGDSDTLQIPKFNFDIKHKYVELLKSFRNKGFEKYSIDKAIQNIRFRLDERGALLKSEARIVALGTSSGGPKRLIFNRPFLLYLKEKGAKYPYFAMWVGNAELLVKE